MQGSRDLASTVSAAGCVLCQKCGLLQYTTECTGTEVEFCSRCQSPLVRCAGKSLDVALGSAAATLLLLIPAFFEPFLTTSTFGSTRSSVLPNSAFDLWHQGWPLLGITVFLFVLLFPAIRFTALTVVLSAMRFGARPTWLGAVFRVANALQTWAMLDVFALGSAVAYARLHASLHVSIDTGAVCLLGAALLSLIARAALDKRRVWRLIAPDAGAHVTRSSILCLSCDLIAAPDREGKRCSRCGAIIRVRRPDGVTRSIALLIAAVLLYFPANLFPIATIPIDFKPTAYTVVGGIIDLSKSRLIGLAVLVFCASFAIPILKMAGLTWCVLSTRSSKQLIRKTRVYRLIEEIGRWSMVDPFTIACFAPVMHFSKLIDGRAGPAATPFAAVVILTTLAVRCFEPRGMWDRAGYTA